jgi:hypothetical protein
MTSILITYFSKYSAAQTIALSRNVITSLRGNTHFMDEPWPSYVTSLDDLEHNTNLLETAHFASQNHDSLMIAQRNQHTLTVQGNMTTIAKHCDLKANGNITALMTSGFPMRKQSTKSRSAKRPIPQPVVTMRHGQTSGTMLGKMQMPAGVKSAEIEFTDGDPNVAENWKRLPTTGSSSFEVTGLTPGKSYTFRVRFITNTGTGPWSNLVTLISL